MGKPDPELVRFVHVEAHGPLEIRAMLTRFGGIEVFVSQESLAHGDLLWQGSNILAARAFVQEKLAVGSYCRA